MLHIGCHLSASKGYLNMGREALAIKADTFQFFSRNPRGSQAKKLDEKDAKALENLAIEHRFAPLTAHAPYTMNACSADPKLRALAQRMMSEDLAVLESLPGNYYNFHPGSHVGQGMEAGVAMIADMLNAVISPRQGTIVLLETMSGKGSEVGGRFEELRLILDRLAHPEKTGICLDTCHVHDAGYDIVHDLDGVLGEFDRILGLKNLKAIHLNDSMNPIGSRKDRHACIGKGEIGLSALVQIVTHPKLEGLPFVLETPNDLAGYAEEIRLLRKAAGVSA